MALLRITRADPNTGYRFVTRPQYSTANETLVILAFPGGGTRATAFSYSVLEFLGNTEVIGPKGKSRLLDHAGVITGVSCGNFTALACCLYDDKLFDYYEQRLLKRDGQGEITTDDAAAARERRIAFRSDRSTWKVVCV